MTHGGLRDASCIAIGSPRLWGLALAGFLARGGIVLFALPILVVPSIVGIVTFIGPDAVSAAGLSSRFVTMVVISVVAIGIWLVLGIVIGVLAELALVEAVAGGAGPVVGPAGADPGSSPVRPDASPGWTVTRERRRLVRRLVAIRVLSLIPFGASLAVASARLFDVGYQEILLPSDVTLSLPERIVRAAPEAIAILALGWLLSEVEGGVASRLAIIDGRPAGPSLLGAIAWVVRHPLLATWVTAATVLGSVVVVGPALVLAVAAWGLVRTALLGTDQAAEAILAVVVFVAAWSGALIVAGIAAAWRSVAWSQVMVRDLRGAGAGPPDGGTL